jgi:hypothetical protein
MHVGYVVHQLALKRGLIRVLKFYRQYFPPTLHTDLQLKATVNKGLTGEVRGPSERSEAFTENVGAS